MIWRRVLNAVNSQLGGAVLFLVFGLLAAGWALDTADRNAHLRDAPVAEARVVDSHRASGKYGDSYVVVEFTTATERVVRAKVDDVRFDPFPRTGGTLRVRYDPDDPERYVRDERLGTDQLGVWIAGSLAALFLLGAVAGFRGRLPRWVIER